MIQDWIVSVTPSANSQKIFQAIDYDDFVIKRTQYYDLPSEHKQRFKGLDDYISKQGGPELDSLRKNYIRLRDEIDEQIKTDNMFETFEIDMFDYGLEIQDLLSSLEEESHIKETYKIKKLCVKKSGLNTSDTNVVIDCIRQGRSLLQAGLEAEMLAKPLIDFYAASAYAYAIIVLNSPLHKSLDSLKGSHGHTYNHHTKTVDFGGDIPSGTFIDLLLALSVENIIQHNRQMISFKYSTLSSVDLVQNNKISISLVPLLSMVPELSNHFEKLDSTHKNVHKLNIDTGVNNGKIRYNFYIGDGSRKPSRENIAACFCTEIINEDQGNYIVSIDSDKIGLICPQIYQDMYGDLWYIESPIKGFHLPELCLHFLIISVLCNIMRYSPHEWSDILTNRTSSRFSLVINQYIRIFERKFPLLVARYLSNYNMIIKSQVRI